MNLDNIVKFKILREFWVSIMCKTYFLQTKSCLLNSLSNALLKKHATIIIIAMTLISNIDLIIDIMSVTNMNFQNVCQEIMMFVASCTQRFELLHGYTVRTDSFPSSVWGWQASANYFILFIFILSSFLYYR